MVEILFSDAGGEGSIPSQGAKIPHASWPKSQNIKNRSNTLTNSLKILKLKKKKEEENKEKSCHFAKYLNYSLPMPHQDSTVASH